MAMMVIVPTPSMTERVLVTRLLACVCAFETLEDMFLAHAMVALTTFFAVPADRLSARGRALYTASIEDG